MSKSTIKMLDPRTLYQQPPYPKTQQAPPGTEKEMIPKIERLVTKAGQRAALFAGDISQQMVTDDLVRKAINTFGSIDILVNNAAFQRTYESFEDISDEPVDGGNAITEAMQFAERYDAAHSQS